MSNYASPTYHHSVPAVSSSSNPSAYTPTVTNYTYGYQQPHAYVVTAPSTSMASGTSGGGGTSTYAPNYGYTSTPATGTTGGYYAHYPHQSSDGTAAAATTATTGNSKFCSNCDQSVWYGVRHESTVFDVSGPVPATARRRSKIDCRCGRLSSFALQHHLPAGVQ